MKKIIIHYSKFNIGGAEKSNLRLINLLCEKGWEVTLLLNYAGGNLENMVPEQVKIVHLAKHSYTAEVANEKHKLKKLIKLAIYAFPLFFQRMKRKKILKGISKTEYDLAVIGLQGLSPEIVVNCIKAKKRLLWIRNDLLHCDPNKKVENNIRKYGDNIDYFPCVSGTSYESFCKIFPEFKEKARVFYNVINAEEMRQKKNAPCDIAGKYLDAFRIITVCRVNEKAKGVFRMLRVYKRLRSEGVFFYWIIVGDGEDYESLKKKVEEGNLSDGFILIGRRENPFPYYNYCNLSATLSYYEGLCGTVNEAKISGLPVLATEFSGVHEQLEHGVNGWIVENDEEAIYQGLKYLIDNPDVIDKITNNILPESIVNDNYKENLLLEFLK